jgi:monoamine oxidase
MTDVVVVGGGLAGLSAARDLMLGGADVVCLEARERPGGRVFAAPLAGGRLAQAVGPLHGRHEPPFYVAGSDHRVAGFMEGAVRTGRAAAAAALGRLVDAPAAGV